MENLRLTMDTERPFQIGAYGYPVIFRCPSPLKDGFPVQIIIKNKRYNTKVIRETEVLEAEEGIVQYMIQEGDFLHAGTHEFQLQQIGDDFKLLSPAEDFPVFRSIT